MTRRAFSALRVIRIQGQLTSRMAQDDSQSPSVLEYLLYVIQRQGRSVPKHVLHPCRSKIDFLYNSQKQYKNQYNLNFLFAHRNSPREVQKNFCRTSAAKRTAGSQVVARLRWF